MRLLDYIPAIATTDLLREELAEGIKDAVLKLQPGESLTVEAGNPSTATGPLFTVTYHEANRRCLCGAGAGPQSVCRHDNDCPMRGVNDNHIETEEEA